MTDQLLLRDYDPVSMLTVKETSVTQPRFPVFDCHIHIGALQMEGRGPVDVKSTVEGLKRAGIFGAINLKMFWDGALKEHLAYMKGYEGFIHTFASVDVTRFEEPGFPVYVDKTLREMKAMGVHGLKFWKNIGCGIKDSSGKRILPDDDRLRPIWESAAKHKMLVLFHIADPKSFFTPVDKNNEFYESLVAYPDWVFYGDGHYSFETLLQAQDNMIGAHPDTLFVIPHVGSNAEDLGWVGGQLDKYPNMYIDTAARNNLLGRQPYTARDFFLKYQDRILFGTDAGFGGTEFEPNFYNRHYRFFETYDEYFRAIPEWGWGQGRWYIYGLGLPDDVLEKFYSGNVLGLLKRVGAV
ncbi:MAG: amidohydrolase family protein [Defluviitaleaceae bacterium]|nr:amidohydrolase family protein [Defluviitaleaceae bacterium]